MVEKSVSHILWSQHHITDVKKISCQGECLDTIYFYAYPGISLGLQGLIKPSQPFLHGDSR